MNGVIVFWITVLLVLVVFTFGSCAKFQVCFDCNNTKFGARICVNVSKFGASYKRISDIFSHMFLVHSKKDSDYKK